MTQEQRLRSFAQAVAADVKNLTQQITLLQNRVKQLETSNASLETRVATLEANANKAGKLG